MFAICTLAAIPLRKQADLLSEMTSQVLFGDHYEVLDTQGNFQHVRLMHDGYEGWITTRQGEEISSEFFHSLNDRPPPILHDLTCAATLGDRQLQLMRGSHLPDEINGKKLVCEGTRITPSPSTFSTEALEELAHSYLHAPYVWGGRSPFGIDCSGFTQMVYKFFATPLPRDSQQQVKVGKPVFNLGESRPGDLAFFFEKTSHVGIITREGILHASSSVRHDDLDETGIRDRQTGEYSHDLTCIRRIIKT